MCLDELSTITCDDFNSPTYVSVCKQVCGGGSAGAGGIGGSGGAGGAGGRAPIPPPTDATTFCHDIQRVTCELYFGCTPPDMRNATFVDLFGSTVDECEGPKAASCANYCRAPYDVTVGTDCIDKFAAFTCDDLTSKLLPDSCSSICPDPTGSGGGGGAGGGAGGSGGGGASGNLIVNGDFSNGQTDWGVTVQAGGLASQIYVITGQLCFSLAANTTVTIGWPTDPSTAFAIRSGVKYQLSYDASTVVQLTSFEAKVGQAVPPYTGTDYRVNETVFTGSAQTFTHTFTAAADDLQAGLAFNVVSATGTNLCLGAVSLGIVN
jgi:hypothetical protein